MKKIYSLLLVFVMLLSLCACGGNKPKQDFEHEVLSCAFTSFLPTIDTEKNDTVEPLDGYPCVTLALRIKNNSTTKTFNSNNISAYYTYENLRHDMDYSLGAVAPTESIDSIGPGCVGTIFMYDMNSTLTPDSKIDVVYTIDGTEYTEKVNSLNPSTKKTEVKKGDVINVYDFYTVEIIDCSAKDYIIAQDTANSEQYYNTNGIDLILKVKNNTDTPFSNIKGYTFANDKLVYGSAFIETNENTTISSLAAKPLEAKSEEYIHIRAERIDNRDDLISSKNLVMRFNIADQCYYCVVNP